MVERRDGHGPFPVGATPAVRARPPEGDLEPPRRLTGESEREASDILEAELELLRIEHVDPVEPRRAARHPPRERSSGRASAASPVHATGRTGVGDQCEELRRRDRPARDRVDMSIEQRADGGVRPSAHGTDGDLAARLRRPRCDDVLERADERRRPRHDHARRRDVDGPDQHRLGHRAVEPLGRPVVGQHVGGLERLEHERRIVGRTGRTRVAP